MSTSLVDTSGPPGLGSGGTDPGRSETSAGSRQVGATELGTITIASRVVAKIASQVASEVDDAGAPAAQLLGRTISKVGLGSAAAGSELDRHPKVDAEVDGAATFLEIKMSVRWPSPIGAVTEQVRQRVSERVSELLGLNVVEITVTVVDLVTTVSTTRVA